MKNILLISILFSTFASAQQNIQNKTYNPLSPPNTYQNADNPNYWRNKMPKEGYWQQDVHYNIKAEINEETDVITATQSLTYWNNSPDDLNFVYFHLYQNAFQPESYLDELQKQNGKVPNWSRRYEKQKLGTTIEEISVNGIDVVTELDNTILKVYLPNTLKPNTSIKFDIKFKTHFDTGDVRRRMAVFNSWGFKHYNGVHWYPRISVYDAKFGWTTDQHLGKEFYGNFGCYDVELTFASNYILEATGYLLNREEMLPQKLREKLDIKNFKDKEWNSPPSTIIPYEKGKKKTWKFHAENVHDFAFTADPTYRIGESRWKDKVCYSLVQEPHASKWQNAAEFGAECLKVFSEDFGMYVYHKVIVADARSGMEYPMITLDGGSDPGYRDLLAHEIGHMWFFGQVGNNETYRALLDEGFTQFLTAWALIKIDGEYMVETEPSNSYKSKFYKPLKAVDSEIYYSYIRDASSSRDPILTTHSDCFHGALGHGGGYRHVYYKTAAMLYNLQYILGDELFLDAMKHYFNTWKIAHPYDNDFRNSIIQFTKIDLNWFFDQWLDTKKRLDYAVENVKEMNNEEYAITFKRKKRMQSSIDFNVIAKNGKTYKYHIPNNWFVKKTEATILPKWHGWDLIHPTYTTIVNIPSGISDVIIDPTERLADSYMPDNRWKKNISYEVDHKLWQYPDWRNYEVKYRPDVWWNDYDGLKLGFNINGGYMQHHHMFSIDTWFNTGLLLNNNRSNSLHPDRSSNRNDYDYYSYRINYNTNLDMITPNMRLDINSQFLAGLYNNRLAFEKTDNKKENKISINLLSLYRTNSNYLILNNGWETHKMNNRINLNVEHKYKYTNGKGLINMTLASSTIGSEYDYNKITLEIKNNNSFNNLIINTRTFLQLGTGNNWPNESKLGLSGANNEEMMNSKFTRSKGIITNEDMLYSNNSYVFHSAGGLNLRGYSGYLFRSSERNDDGDKSPQNYGTSGASINTEIDFTSYLPHSIRKYNFNTYLFGDMGIISHENISKENYSNAFSDVLIDGGIGFTYTISKFGPLEKVNPLIIRIDIPLYLNELDQDKMKFIIGVNRVL